MGWPFLYLVRELYHGSNPWGTLFTAEYALGNRLPAWEKLCYTYELPWKADQKGKSITGKSRIDIGIYEMDLRGDGPKGWRLELIGTEPRKHIQLHRAHKSMYIEGCILPVNAMQFAPFPFGLEKDELTQFFSETLMDVIRMRYERLARTQTGNPTIEIAAKLPALLELPSNTAIA